MDNADDHEFDQWLHATNRAFTESIAAELDLVEAVEQVKRQAAGNVTASPRYNIIRRDKLAIELKKKYERGASIRALAESTGRWSSQGSVTRSDRHDRTFDIPLNILRRHFSEKSFIQARDLVNGLAGIFGGVVTIAYGQERKRGWEGPVLCRDQCRGRRCPAGHGGRNYCLVCGGVPAY